MFADSVLLCASYIEVVDMKLEQEGRLEEKKIVNIKSQADNIFRNDAPTGSVYNCMGIGNMAPSLVKLYACFRVMNV